jgi:hypothetical protein
MSDKIMAQTEELPEQGSVLFSSFNNTIKLLTQQPTKTPQVQSPAFDFFTKRPTNESNLMQSGNSHEVKIVERLLKEQSLFDLLLKPEDVSFEAKNRIEKLELSVRTYKCLKSAGIHTILELIERRRELLRIRNIGPKRVEEIHTQLHKRLGIIFVNDDCEKRLYGHINK